MNILVVGASQGTGALAVYAAPDRGHKVTAFARSPQKLRLNHPELRRVVGDFHQTAEAVLVVARPCITAKPPTAALPPARATCEITAWLDARHL